MREVILEMRLIATCLVLALTSSSHGAIVTLTTDQSKIGGRDANQGWWTNSTTVNNSDGNTNVGTGTATFGGGIGVVTQHSYFTFDLNAASLAGMQINSATLRVSLGNSPGLEPTETLELFDVSTDAVTLNGTGETNNTIKTNIFNDLGSGTSYGTTDFNTGGAANSLIDFNLNADGLNAIALAAGAGGSPNYFSIGAVLTTASQEYVFADVDFGFGAASLVIDATAVPEPGAMTVLALGSAAGAFIRRRRP